MVDIIYSSLNLESTSHTKDLNAFFPVRYLPWYTIHVQKLRKHVSSISHELGGFFWQYIVFNVATHLIHLIRHSLEKPFVASFHIAEPFFVKVLSIQCHENAEFRALEEKNLAN